MIVDDFLTKQNAMFIDTAPKNLNLAVFTCSPSDTMAISIMLSKAGYWNYCPFHIKRVRVSRHAKTTVPIVSLPLSGYVFVAPVYEQAVMNMFRGTVRRLLFADTPASVSLLQLLELDDQIKLRDRLESAG